mmetsp:Transcript_27304/g.81569  ORF Transcript_27304/g.81569 Transcript_27304/m.81569 type:complete len:381 (+) Transcript_27304:104-1246(+)
MTARQCLMLDSSCRSVLAGAARCRSRITVVSMPRKRSAWRGSSPNPASAAPARAQRSRARCSRAGGRGGCAAVGAGGADAPGGDSGSSAAVTPRRARAVRVVGDSIQTRAGGGSSGWGAAPRSPDITMSRTGESGRQLSAVARRPPSPAVFRTGGDAAGRAGRGATGDGGGDAGGEGGGVEGGRAATRSAVPTMLSRSRSPWQSPMASGRSALQLQSRRSPGVRPSSRSSARRRTLWSRSWPSDVHRRKLSWTTAAPARCCPRSSGPTLAAGVRRYSSQSSRDRGSGCDLSTGYGLPSAVERRMTSSCHPGRATWCPARRLSAIPITTRARRLSASPSGGAGSLHAGRCEVALPGGVTTPGPRPARAVATRAWKMGSAST